MTSTNEIASFAYVFVLVVVVVCHGCVSHTHTHTHSLSLSLWNWRVAVQPKCSKEIVYGQETTIIQGQSIHRECFHK